VTVDVKLFATLRKYLPPEAKEKKVRLTLDEGRTVGDALDAAGVPRAEAHLLILNGDSRSLDHPLRDGDTLSVFPPVAGG
jgi:molybdopterin converting factor small subunit